MRLETHVSAGGVVYRPSNDSIEVVLCGRNDPPLWGLPKGTPDAGETVEQTAAREVREETGLDIEIEGFIGSIKYWFSRPGTRISKTVHFYLMRPVGGSLGQHDPEFDQVGWFESNKALETLTHLNEAGIVRQAIAMVRDKPVSGTPQCR